MEQFIALHRESILGVLAGFDRMVFRGSFKSISYVKGMEIFLSAHGVLLKDFQRFANRCTAQLSSHAQAVAAKAGRPYRYLESSGVDKEGLARSIAEKDGVKDGLICVLSCVEPCKSFDVYRNQETKHLELVRRERKCRFFYFYYQHKEFGLMYVRLQSWLPFDVQVGLNGRSYLARQLDRAGIKYHQSENCFTWIEDVPRAQRLLDRLTGLAWVAVLDRLASAVNPLRRKGQPLAQVFSYYWTMRQSEYATDVMFKDRASLEAVYGALSRYAIEHLHSRDVLRFLGKKAVGRFSQQVTSDLKERIEGVRVKHHVGSNSIKMYDKQGSVLRIETTINDPSRFRVWRRAQGSSRSKLAWRELRKNVADIGRRVAICRAANGRYLQALAAVTISAPAHRVLDPVNRAVRRDGRSSRGLRLLDPKDVSLFRAVMRGEHLIDGLTNGQLRQALFPQPARDESERKRRISYVSRQLRLLRAHGLIHKVNQRRLYRISDKGHQVMSVTITLHQTETSFTKAA